MSLEDEYRRLCSTPSDINQHLPTLVAETLRLNAQQVIELGVRSGVSTVAFLYALEQTGGRLISIDIDGRPDIGDHDRWTFIQGDDCDPDLYASLSPADVVFIDTSHLYKHTVAELNLYRWLVRPGGVIICHDTMLQRPEGAPIVPAFPVRVAVERFCEAEGYEWRNVDIWPGLGVIQL